MHYSPYFIEYKGNSFRPHFEQEKTHAKFITQVQVSDVGKGQFCFRLGTKPSLKLQRMHFPELLEQKAYDHALACLESFLLSTDGVLQALHAAHFPCLT